jgi:hypothetical protein
VNFSSREFELKKIIVIALTLASLSLMAGLAVADQFVGNGGSIQGCVKNGLLEVVKAGKRCPRHSTPLPFNQVGPRGRQGIQGIQGPQGVQGIPGPATATAPSGITQRGFFIIDGETSGDFGDDPGTSIAFPLELSASPTVVEVPNGVPNPDPTHCPGSPEAPSAAPGYLCLYDRLEANLGQAFPGQYLQVFDADIRIGHASPFGARLIVVPEIAAGHHIEIDGSWAVTAP